jgi:hypothetical protein
MVSLEVTERRGAHGPKAFASNGVALIGAPRLVRNSSSVTKDSVFVYWVSPKGEIQAAADTRITEAQLRNWPEYRHWRRCEATGPKEIEKISIIISRQMWEKKKQMKVQQHLREKFALDQMAVRCKIRIAQGYSKNDEGLNRKLLARTQANEDALMKLIASEFDPTMRTTALDMEVRSQSTSRLAHVGQKPQGIA